MIVLSWPSNKIKSCKTLHYWSGDMLNFVFLKRGLRIVSPPHFVYDVSRKLFLKLNSINWPSFIAWLPLLLEILVNRCIAIVCWPGCDVIEFEIDLIFLIKPFSYMLSLKNIKTKILISWERKELLTWNEKYFASFLKGFQLPKVVSDLRVCL